MSDKVPCIECGAEILPATAERTGGRCMPCFQDPDRGRRLRLKAEAERMSAQELSGRIEEIVTAAALRVCAEAVSSLGEEGIYGCWLFHSHSYGVVGITVFTEAGLDQEVCGFAEKYGDWGADWVADRGSRSSLRWSPSGSPRHPGRDKEFGEAWDFYDPLHKKLGEEAGPLEIERICLRVLARIRDAALFDSSVFLTLAEGDQNNEERWVYGGLFSTPQAMEAYRAGVPPLNMEHVELYRSRIPRFEEGY